MHIVTWTYEVMEGKNRSDLQLVIDATAGRYASTPGLAAKYSAVSPDARRVTEFYVWKTKDAADRFFDREWEGEATRDWESARMTREDFDVVNAVVPGRAAIEA